MNPMQRRLNKLEQQARPVLNREDDPIGWRNANGGRFAKVTGVMNNSIIMGDWDFIGFFYPPETSVDWTEERLHTRLLMALKHCRTTDWFVSALAEGEPTPDFWKRFIQPALHWTRWGMNELVRRLAGMIEAEKDEYALEILRCWLHLRSLGQHDHYRILHEYPKENIWLLDAFRLQWYEEERGEVDFPDGVEAIADRIVKKYWHRVDFNINGADIDDTLFYQCMKVYLYCDATKEQRKQFFGETEEETS